MKTTEMKTMNNEELMNVTGGASLAEADLLTGSGLAIGILADDRTSQLAAVGQGSILAKRKLASIKSDLLRISSMRRPLAESIHCSFGSSSRRGPLG